MKRLFLVYQLTAAFVLLPLSYLLWFRSLHDHRVAALIVFLPALFSYLNSGFAANVTKLFKFKSNQSLGGILLLHGFIFAGGSALLLYGSLSATGAGNPLSLLRTAVCGAGVFGLAIWLFDTLLLRSGILNVRNRPAAEGASAEAIAASTLVTIGVPIGAFVLFSFHRHGYSGLIPYAGKTNAPRKRRTELIAPKRLP